MAEAETVVVQLQSAEGSLFSLPLPALKLCSTIDLMIQGARLCPWRAGCLVALACRRITRCRCRYGTALMLV